MSEFFVVVTFETTPDNHDEALGLLDEYINGFLALQPGFLKSRLLEGESGYLHFARWEQESDFRAFAELARDHPLLPRIRAFNPSAKFYCEKRLYTG